MIINPILFSVKLGTLTLGLISVIGLVFLTIEPSVQIAIITVIPLIITSVGGFYMQILARKDAKKLHESVTEVKQLAKITEVNTNDRLTRLLIERNQASARADHAEGRLNEKDLVDSKH